MIKRIKFLGIPVSDQDRANGVEFTGSPEKQPWGTFVKMRDSEGNQILLSSR